MTISVDKMAGSSPSKCLSGHQGQTLKKRGWKCGKCVVHLDSHQSFSPNLVGLFQTLMLCERLVSLISR